MTKHARVVRKKKKKKEIVRTMTAALSKNENEINKITEATVDKVLSSLCVLVTFCDALEK